MQALKVTAELAGPIAGDVPKLDALIERAMAHRCDPEILKPRDGDGEFVPDAVPIPITRRRVTGFPFSIPLCSSPIFVADHDQHDFFHKRFDPDPALLADRQRGVFASNSGEFRSYSLPLRSRNIRRVVWFCVGRGTEIRRLLRDVTYLGKKSSIGYGPVSRWTVQEAADDFSWFAPAPAMGGCDSRIVLMRPLPATTESLPGFAAGRNSPGRLVGYRRWFGGVVAPYWAAKYHVEMLEPC